MDSTLIVGEINVLSNDSSTVSAKTEEAILITTLPVNNANYEFSSIYDANPLFNDGVIDPFNHCPAIETSPELEFAQSYSDQDEIVGAYLQVGMMMAIALAISLIAVLIKELEPKIAITTVLSRKEGNSNQ